MTVFVMKVSKCSDQGVSWRGNARHLVDGVLTVCSTTSRGFQTAFTRVDQNCVHHVETMTVTGVNLVRALMFVANYASVPFTRLSANLLQGLSDSTINRRPQADDKNHPL